MNHAWSMFLMPFALAASGSVAAATLPVSYVQNAADDRQKTWHATLDLRDLPAGARPASLDLRIDARKAAARGAGARVTVSLNGLVVGRAWVREDMPTRLSVGLEDRLLSTRNHVALAVTATSTRCAGRDCSVGDASLVAPVAVGLGKATAGPLTFAQYVTRFRAGVRITAGDAQQRALADLVKQAMAPQAPVTADGAAEIVVGRSAPQGASPALRFDGSPVEIRNRDGAVLYDQPTLEALTIVQITRRGDRPVLWVRPGRLLPEGPLDLDYGTIALFGKDGREIAFSPDQDDAVGIAYAADAQREARLGLYWRLAILGVWLAITAGFVFLLRRMPRLERKAA